jgi:hypothetical protein
VQLIEGPEFKGVFDGRELELIDSPWFKLNFIDSRRFLHLTSRLQKEKKPARRGLLLFLLYKFRISD